MTLEERVLAQRQPVMRRAQELESEVFTRRWLERNWSTAPLSDARAA